MGNYLCAGESRCERERCLPRASRTVRSVWHLVRELVRNWEQCIKVAHHIVRIQADSICMCPRALGLMGKPLGTWWAMNCNSRSQFGNYVCAATIQPRARALSAKSEQNSPKRLALASRVGSQSGTRHRTRSPGCPNPIRKHMIVSAIVCGCWG